MHRHQVVGADEKIDVVRGKTARAIAKIDPVQDGVEVAIVGLDLRIVQVGTSILDRQWVKRERVAQNQRFRNGRRRQVDPDVGIVRRIEPRAIKARGSLRLPIAMDVGGDQVSLRPGRTAPPVPPPAAPPARGTATR